MKTGGGQDLQVPALDGEHVQGGGTNGLGRGGREGTPTRENRMQQVAELTTCLRKCSQCKYSLIGHAAWSEGTFRPGTFRAF